MKRQGRKTSDPVMLEELTAPLQAVQKLNCADVPVRSVTDDSRRLAQGYLFVAVAGERADGHSFIAEAVRLGASAVVCEKVPWPLPPCPVIQVPDSRRALSALASALHGRPAERLCVVGITGTDGKTTTTELVRAILCEAGRPTGSLGSVRYNLGARALDSNQTTPHPLALHAMLREMSDAGLTHVALEVSSHGLVQQRTAHVPFNVAVLTHVSHDHTDYHGSQEAYIRAKQILFEELPPESVAVLNADARVCERYRRAIPEHATVLTYGVRNPADVKLEARQGTLQGTRMLVHTPLRSYAIESRLIGDFNCENVLAAATVAFALGVPPRAVRNALQKFKGVAGRLERIELPGRSDLPAVFVDYAHTPDALGRALGALRPFVRGRLICVMGCGGDRDRRKRPLMGRVATSLADLTVVTADNSRSERTEDIIAEIVGGIQAGAARYAIEPDRRAAIEMAIDGAGPGDVVALCGRGCERFQILGERRIPLDDRIAAREVLRRRTDRMRRSA